MTGGGGKCPGEINCPRISKLLSQNINAEQARGMGNPRVASNTLTTTSLVIVWPVELQVIGNWNIFHLLVVYVFFGNGPKVSLYFSEFYILRTRK